MQSRRTTGTAPSEFVEQLRDTVQRYLQAVDEFETAHGKYYRLSSPERVSADLGPFHQNYLRARKELEALIPRARQLSKKHGLADPWSGLMHVRLGARAPQEGYGSAIGQGERTLIARCLAALDAESYPEASVPKPRRGTESGGVLRRLFNYFF